MLVVTCWSYFKFSTCKFQFVRYQYTRVLNLLCCVLIREVIESESAELREQNTSSTPSPNASQSQVQEISNPKKLLLKFVNKITKNKKKNSGGCEEWMCTLCNHVFQGTYTRVWHHLLSLLGDGVKGCHVGLKEGWRWPSFIWFFH